MHPTNPFKTKDLFITTMKTLYDAELDQQFAKRSELKQLNEYRQTTQVLVHSNKLEEQINASSSRARAYDEIIQHLANN
jgi:hypothetical protein